MTFAIRRRKKRQSGSATIEFLLSILPMIAVIFATLDIAWYIFAWASIEEGAREGVRFVVTGSGQSESTLDAQVKGIVQKYSAGFAQTGNIYIDYYPSSGYSPSGVPTSLDGTSGATAIGNVVKVTVYSAPLKSFGPVFRAFQPVNLVASASDVMQ